MLGEYCPGSFWYGTSEAKSGVEERLRAIFSQYGPELVRVNKEFIIWLCLTLYYSKSESWWNGMNETVYRKALRENPPPPPEYWPITARVIYLQALAI